MERIEIWLPWPPALNHMYRHYRNSVYLSEEAQKYKKKVDGLFGWQGECIWKAERLTVRITAFPPDRRTRDTDGILKCLLDAVPAGVGGIWADDSQVAELYVLRVYDSRHRGSIRMEISECGFDGVKK